MRRSKYGAWTYVSESTDVAAYKVATHHQFHNTECICGTEAHTARGRTEHIIDMILEGLYD